MIKKQTLKAYINATSIRSAFGGTGTTLEAIFKKQSAIKVYEDIVPNKSVAIGRFNTSKDFYSILFDSIDEVLNTSNLHDFSDTLLLVGSSVGGMATTERIFFKENSYENVDTTQHTIDTIAFQVNHKYNFLSTRSFSTACTSSANALKTAKELISIGAYKNVLVIGADEICHTTIFGFSALGILSDEICTPFQKERKGMNVAEGIGILLLQNTKQIDSIELIGAGTSSDAHHIANPDPEARGAISAIRNAIDNAQIKAIDIAYINAHGTGTEANDSTEAKAILEIFTSSVPVSSSKANIGHTLGAAGAIEAILCVEVLKKTKITSSIRCK
ncbi:beta-ketoacyl synthase N-terminal-like domain-containing protein [Sulfurimonas sp.]|uniref:beta-ketoacyl synthase N-terminal-like domain-containing protein n=1 Tax=Sulfurimonas sp. TaxID=2022749 RepID=UPI002AB0CB6E|nr:beta-ketoacyl synthase N-terminal-like domain-containing protein [Sulfurimonas sp.]